MRTSVVSRFKSLTLLQSRPYLTKSALFPILTAHHILPHSKSFTAFSGKMESVIRGGTSHAINNIKYVPIEDVEKLERYRPGGYHPISI